MARKTRFVLCFTFAVAVVGASVSTAAFQRAGQASRVVDRTIYERVLDLVFPRNLEASNYRVVLRFRPSNQPECQLVLLKELGVSLRVIESTSASGNIFHRLDALIRRGPKETAEELAKRIVVRTRSIEIPDDRGSLWHAEFLDAIMPLSETIRKETAALERTRTASVIMDGTDYDLWYEWGFNSMSFHLSDDEVTDRPNGRSKLVRWMNSVRLEVARR
jgi:hypothetical protein